MRIVDFKTFLNEGKSLQTFYHATSLEAVPKIKKEGLKPIWDFVYLTDSIESAQRWMGFRFQAMGQEGFAVIEVKMDPAQLEKGSDHSPLMHALFGAGESLTYDKRIPPSKITKIHYFEFAKDKIRKK